MEQAVTDPKSMTVEAALCADLRKWANACEDTEDADTGAMAVFVPDCITGDFYDVLTASAERIATLAAEVEALRRDAERYRWLRDIEAAGWPAVRVPRPCPDGIRGCRTQHTAPKRGDALDAAIDRALLAEGRQTGGSDDRTKT